jgi:hypothetical protein
MKTILIAAALASLLPAQTITWTKEHETSVQNSTTQFASNPVEPNGYYWTTWFIRNKTSGRY